MISYNDVLEVSKLYKHKQYDKVFSYITERLPSKNIIDFLKKCKAEKFIETNDCIKLDISKKELIIYKDDFLKNLPLDKEDIYHIDNYKITIGYPNIDSILPASCIKKLQYKDILLNINPTNYNDIPLSLVKKCMPYIQTYLDKLNDMYVYYVNDKYNSRFLYNKYIIINIIYLCFVQQHDSLIQQQLLLMKQYNFTYQDFNHISMNSVNAYVKIINLKLNKEDA
jgi:hypothetical protein